jgi:hypothetical protein
MTNELVPVVEPDGVSAPQPAHAGDQVCIGGLHHQVVVVGNETIGMDLPARLLAGLGQSFEKVVAVHVIQKNVLAPVAAAHDACLAVAFGEEGWYIAPGYWMRSLPSMECRLTKLGGAYQEKRFVKA